MKKAIWVIIGVLVLGGGFAVNSIMDSEDSSKLDQSDNNHSSKDIIDPQAALVDPCTVFTKSEIEEAFKVQFVDGVAVEDEKSDDKNPITKCAYRQNNDGTKEDVQSSYEFIVVVESYSSTEMAERIKDDLPTSENNQSAAVDFVKENQLYRLIISKQKDFDSSSEKARLLNVANSKN
jgi:hypothetical protein